MTYITKQIMDGKVVNMASYRVTRIDSNHNAYGKRQNGRLPESEAEFLGHCEELFSGSEYVKVIREFRFKRS